MPIWSYQEQLLEKYIYSHSSQALLKEALLYYIAGKKSPYLVIVLNPVLI